MRSGGYRAGQRHPRHIRNRETAFQSQVALRLREAGACLTGRPAPAAVGFEPGAKPLGAHMSPFGLRAEGATAHYQRVTGPARRSGRIALSTLGLPSHPGRLSTALALSQYVLDHEVAGAESPVRRWTNAIARAHLSSFRDFGHFWWTAR
jgi:hypothetical protein